MVSRLTDSEPALLAAIANGLGGSVSHLTSTEAQLLAAIANEAGGSVSHLTSSPERLLAAAVNASGGSVSALGTTELGLLAALHNALSDDPDISPLASSEEAMLELISIATAGGGGYTAQAVHWDGATYLENAALACTDSRYFLCSYWCKTLVGDTLLVTDPEGNANNLLYVFTGSSAVSLSAGGASYFEVRDNDALAPPVDGAWHHVLQVCDTNQAQGAKVAKIRIDDIDQTLHVSDVGVGFVATFNGLLQRFGMEAPPAVAPYDGDLADFQMYLLPTDPFVGGDIPLATRRLFINGSSKPVDPATAVATLGTPVILFSRSGAASTFATNQGSGGAFTVAAGALTNASTSPSD